MQNMMKAHEFLLHIIKTEARKIYSGIIDRESESSACAMKWRVVLYDYCHNSAKSTGFLKNK